MQPAADGDPGHPGAGTATAACGRLSTAQDRALLISPPAFMSCSLRPGHSWGLDVLRPALGSNGKHEPEAWSNLLRGHPRLTQLSTRCWVLSTSTRCPAEPAGQDSSPAAGVPRDPAPTTAPRHVHKVLNSSKVFTHRRRSGPRTAPRAQRVGVGAMLPLSQGQRFTFRAEQREPGHLD